MSENTGLVARVESLATQALAAEHVADALEVAKYALSVNVHDAETEEQASAMTLKLSKASKEVAALKKPYSATLREATAMLAAKFKPVEDRLAQAAAYLDNQIKTHKLAVIREQEKARREAEERRLAAEREQKEAERKAAEAGRPAPVAPPAPVQSFVPTPPQTRVEQGTVSLKWLLKFEMVAPHEVPAEWLVLDNAQARAWGNAHVAEEGLEKKEGSSVVVRGIRYWYEPDVSKTGR